MQLLGDFSNGDLDHVSDAGKKFAKMLQAGSSRPWPDILNEMTGSKKLDASALVEYFSPLEGWLDDQISNLGIPVGWNSTIDDFFPNENSTTAAPTSSSTTTTMSTTTTTATTTKDSSAFTTKPMVVIYILLLALILVNNNG